MISVAPGGGLLSVEVNRRQAKRSMWIICRRRKPGWTD